MKKTSCSHMRGARSWAMAFAVAYPAWAFAAPPAPQKIIAVLDGTQNFGTTRRAVNFYDITTLTGTVFSQQPLFSVWTGYESAATANFEDPDAITVNPVNGTVYVSAFDSGTPGLVDAFGDTEGDYDLYRVDYQKILADFQANNRPRGTMYAPTVGPDGNANVAHPDHVGTTVFISSAIQKVGEIGRPQNGPTFDYDIEFVNPAAIAVLDNQNESDAAVNDILANDHQLRLWERSSTTPGGAVYNAATKEGGFNAQTTQTWGADILSLVGMDTVGRSEPVDMAFVSRDGVSGAWVGESDGGGDGVSFFQFDLAGADATAFRKEMFVNPQPFPTGFSLDEDPVVNAASNDGELDWLAVDGAGNLRIGESGFFDAPQAEPKVIGREILNYDGADSNGNGQREINFGAWTTSANLPTPPADDDTAVTDGRFATVDKATGSVVYFDIDSGALPNVVSDAYIFDPATGSFVYTEQNAANHFNKRHGTRIFTRGDVTGDGLVNDLDIDTLFDNVADPTLGGTVPAALGQEWFDLTGDSLLSGAISSTSDAGHLVRSILGTEFGDANLDGRVSLLDLDILGQNFNQPGGWADGDFNGSGTVSLADLDILGQFFGAGGPAVARAYLASKGISVPEPSSWALMALGGTACLIRARRRNQGKEQLAG